MNRHQNPTRPYRPTVALMCLAIAFLASACGNHFAEPPVEITSRDSLIGAGKVVLIRNVSDSPLEDLRVTIIGSDNSRHAFQQSSLGAHQSFELGWKKLGGWEIPAGARVELRCSGYFRAHRSQLSGEQAVP